MCVNDSNSILAGTRICMVVYSYYPMDQRVRREAETLKEKGAIVHVICLRNKNERKFDKHNGISIYRVPQKRKKSGGYLEFFLRYLTFLLLTTTILTGLFFIHRYRVVHVHSIPDSAVFCAIIPKLFGAKVILDLHESMPEVFATRFKVSMNSKQVYLVKIVEKVSVRFADFVLFTSDHRKEITMKRTYKKEVAVIMNLPKGELFIKKDMTHFIKENGLESSFIACYVGGMDPWRELDVVIKAIKYVEKKIPNIVLILCGTGEKEYVDSLNKLVGDLNLKKKVLYIGYVPQKDVLNYVSISNVALNPYMIHPNLDGISSTKVFEYLLVPKPVIVTNFSVFKREFKGLVLFYESSDYKSLGDKIFEVYEKESDYNKMAHRAQDIIFKKFNPKRNEEKLVKIYLNLILN